MDEKELMTHIANESFEVLGDVPEVRNLLLKFAEASAKMEAGVKLTKEDIDDVTSFFDTMEFVITMGRAQFEEHLKSLEES